MHHKHNTTHTPTVSHPDSGPNQWKAAAHKSAPITKNVAMIGTPSGATGDLDGWDVRGAVTER